MRYMTGARTPSTTSCAVTPVVVTRARHQSGDLIEKAAQAIGFGITCSWPNRRATMPR